MKHKTKKEMEELLLAYSNYSGNKKDFCADQGIKAHTLYYWQRKLANSSCGSKGTNFIPLQIKAVDSISRIEVSYPNGNIVRLPANSPIDLLEQLLQISC